MAVPNEALVLDLIEWIGEQPRPYAEVLAAWRTSCPRLTIWEDAVDAGFVERCAGAGGAPMVRITPAGSRFLNTQRPKFPASA